MVRRLAAPVLVLAALAIGGAARAQQPYTQEPLPPLPGTPQAGSSGPPNGAGGAPTPYGQSQYGQAPYNPAPYGQAPYSQAPYPQPPYSQGQYTGPSYPPPPAPYPAVPDVTAPAPTGAAPTAPGPAGAPAGDQDGRVFCQQTVSFRLADPSAVPERYRRLIGVWSDAAWDARTCAALVVENVRQDGTASIVYAFGPLESSSRGPGGVLRGTGVVRDGQLLFQNSDGSQFAFRPLLADLSGQWTTPKGQTFQTVFKQTP